MRKTLKILILKILDKEGKKVKIVSLFNNKGGVGKSTLSYHLGCALGTLDKKVLFVDLDPQCNLTINDMFENEIENIWQEDPYMDDFSEAMERNPQCEVFRKPRSVHLLLKPVEDGFSEFETLPPAKKYQRMFIFCQEDYLFINLNLKFQNDGMDCIKGNH